MFYEKSVMVYFKILYCCIQKIQGPITSHVTHSSSGLHHEFKMGTYKIDVKHFNATLSFSVYFFYEREYFQCMKRSVLCLTLYLVKSVKGK